ncbi:Lin0512 family protein [uncultured Halomonas sp.]|uniref:Lin0512 family protein n=1 Tax=Halomonas mongoliensis TaxID=321265 RepID=UPI00260D3750|nr:Lin0512 family protein [uncultured Halomonas sp.]
MTERRIILEMGTGNDLYGEDYTKAACRAVQDALHHSSIVLFKSMGLDHREMRVEVTVGVQRPERVDAERVASELPRGRAEVSVVHGGLNVHDPDNATTHVIATAAIAALLHLDRDRWRLSDRASSATAR